MSHRQYFEQLRSEQGRYILNWLPADCMRTMALAMPIHDSGCEHLIRINQGYTVPVNMGIASVVVSVSVPLDMCTNVSLVH